MVSCDGTAESRLLVAPVPCNLTKNDTSTSTAPKTGCMVPLCHPKSGTRMCYLLMNGCLSELHWFKQSYGSWFIGDYVCEDGSLYIATPVDPVFVLLPIFEVARMAKANDRGMFRQLDEILYVDSYPGYHQLMAIAEDSMQVVCEIKEVGTSRFFRLDDSKVLAWLCCKVNQLKVAFSKLDKTYAAQDKKGRLIDIVSLLSEYMKDQPWLALLCSHLDLDMEEVHSKASKSDMVPISIDDTPVATYPAQERNSNTKSSSSGKQSKKQKIETDSRNIKDMFRRASRRGS